MEERKYGVIGMTCAACASAVEKAARRTEGVEDASVSLGTDTLRISTTDEFSENDLLHNIKKAGYRVDERSTDSKTVDLEIEGMTCAACSAAVEKALNALDGVNSAEVSLSNDTARVVFDPEMVNVSRFTEAVRKAGYRADIKKDKGMPGDKYSRSVEIRSYRNRFIVSVVFALPLLIVAMAPMMGIPFPNVISPHENPLNYALLQLFLTAPILIAGRDFYLKGIPGLFRGSPNMDTLVGLGTGAAVIYGLYATVRILMGHTEYAMDLYFEVAGVLVALILLGKLFENISRGRTSEAIRKLLDLSPRVALVKRDNGYVQLPLSEVEVGDQLLVKAGMSIPVDGKVISGESSVNQAMITGESIPVDVKEDSSVIGGTVNISSPIEMKATAVGSQTALARIIRLVEEAQSSKAPIARIADIISGRFVHAVLLIAAVTFLAWMIAGYGVLFATTMTIAVLVIACPCALGLATPMAIMVGTGKGAENGILFRNAESLEMTHKASTVVLDKTGTVTIGKPTLIDVIPLNGFDHEEVMSFAGALAMKSSHPLDRAIVEKLDDQSDISVEQFNVEAGKGISGIVAGRKVKMGNRKLIDNHGDEGKNRIDELNSSGKTALLVEIDGIVSAILGIADTVKESSQAAIEALKDRGIEVVLLTGDNEKVAGAVGKKLGISRVVAEVLPEDKIDVVRELRSSGEIVAMVGDGINDSPALAEADVGIAIGSGTDIAVESSDVVLMRDDLMDVVRTMRLSKATMRNIKQNLFWAFFYNTLGIPVAAGVFYLSLGLRLNPMIAGAAMAFSSVSVVLNALRLRRLRI